MPANPPPPDIIRAVRFWWERATGGSAPDIWQLWWDNVLPAWQEAGAPNVNSWWRSGQGNRDVSGERFSQHLLGLAFDLEAGTDPTPFTRRGFTVQVAPTHVHVQTFPAAVRVVEQVDRLTRRPVTDEA